MFRHLSWDSVQGVGVQCDEGATEGCHAVAAGDPVVAAGAKLAANSAALRAAAGAHQVCGGWGHLAESGLHTFTRAIKAAEGQLGTPLALREVIARSLR